MLLAGGTAADVRRLLTADSVRLITADHTTTNHQQEIGALLLKAQGLGSNNCAVQRVQEGKNVFYMTIL